MNKSTLPLANVNYVHANFRPYILSISASAVQMQHYEVKTSKKGDSEKYVVLNIMYYRLNNYTLKKAATKSPFILYNCQKWKEKIVIVSAN